MTNAKSKKRLAGAIIAVLVLACAIVAICFLWNKSEKEDLLQERNDALLELEERIGEYDERTIVLPSTSESEARSLAGKLSATLRITSDGSFATLTLPEGTTIRDVYANDEYLKYIPAFSPDYHANIGGYYEGNDNGQGLVPSAPTSGYTSLDELGGCLDYLNLKNVWNSTKGSGVTVAVIDTGIDTDHPEFAGRISPYSYNATLDKRVIDYTLEDGSYDWSLIEDEQGHGTSVAGALGASMDGSGTVGVAPSVTILVVKAECDESGTFARTSDLVFGLYYAIEQDASVVNMSFGTYQSINPFESATELAVDSDIICVAAAGNNGTAMLSWPAADENVIGVGALAEDSFELAEYSNYGENVDIVAPGSVYTASMGGEYKTATGTSLSSPLVSGAVALFMSRDRYATYDEVTDVLFASSRDLGDLGRDWDYGFGVIDVYGLVLETRGKITYNMMTDELDNVDALFVYGHTLQEMLEPERLYAVFDGWYYDPYFTEEFVYFEDVFNADITLYAKWSGEEDGIPYTYVELPDGTMEIRSYTGRRRYISIPTYIDDKPVTSIGDFAFSGETNLREINLPETLTHIGQYAFGNCANLTKISIPAGVTEIEEGAFYNNIRLSTVAFEGKPTLKTVGSQAFAYCSSLRRIELPASLTSIDGSAFLGTLSLGAINVSFDNKSFMSTDGVLFNKTGSTLIAYPAGLAGNYSVPTGTQTIDAYAFAFTRAELVSLGGVTAIGANAFANSSIASVTIPDSVTSLGAYAFAGCSRLASVTYGNGLTSVPTGAFQGCASLKSFFVPKNVSVIGIFAFAGSALETVSFAEDGTLAAIGASAFAGCNLREIAIPASVVQIGGGAFAYNYLLSSVTFGEESVLRVIGANAFEKTYSLTEIALPASLVQLGDFAFLASGLSGEIALPASLTYLGAGAFGACEGLTAIRVDAQNAAYNDVDGVVYAEDGKTLVAYPAGKAASSYTVLDGTVTIGEAAFYGSGKLSYLYLPETLESLSPYALAYAYSLRSLSIPDNVTQLGRYAFVGTRSLSSVSFGAESRLPRIGYAAFAGAGIRSLTIPKNVSAIAQYAFADCDKLTSITFAANSKLEAVTAYMFDGCDNLQSITFRNGSALKSIQAHGFEGMCMLRSVSFGDAQLENVDNYAFRFCESLTSISLPASVTNIGRYAFYACYDLATIALPAGVEHIGSYAFLGTDTLEVYFASETLPLYLDEDWDRGIKGYYLGVTDVVTDGDFTYARLASGGIAILSYTGTATELDMTSLGFGDIVTIGGKAFYYSTLERVVLPDTLVTIQTEAFYHANLTSLEIPASVEFIGRSAFADTPMASLTFAKNGKLKTVEQSAFERTKSLTAVTLPASVENLGRAVFRDSGIIAVTFADGTVLTEISEEAFAGTALTSVTLPESISRIGAGAFRETASLSTVIFPKGELWIEENAFYLSGLESLHIHENVTHIGEFAFVGLDNLTTITVAEGNPYYTAINGMLLSKDGRKLITLPAGKTGALTLPSSVEIIGFGAFERTSLDAVTFAPDANILSFGYRAFFGAKNLTEITVPASVISIDYYAFGYAEALEKVIFAEGSRLTGVYEGAFYGCHRLKDITLPDTVVDISDFAFYGCSSLTKLPVSEETALKGIYSYAFAYSGLAGKLSLPETLIDIDDYAFLGTKITSATIPNTNARDLILGIGIFEECASIEHVSVPFIGASFEDGEITWFSYIFGAGAYEAGSTYTPESLKTVAITSDITFVGSSAFYNLASLEKIDVSETVNTLYEYAFGGTTANYSLAGEIRLMNDRGLMTYVPSSTFGNGIMGDLILAEGVTSIGYGAFSGCTSLTSITIPDSVTNIENFAFKGCTSLTSIEIPDGVTSIGDVAFDDCTSLTSIEIPDSVTSIGSNAFSGCTSLTSITIPDSVTSIGGSAFSGCTSLTSITIPDSVTSIGVYAFSGCTSLTSIEIPDGVTSIGDRAFSNCTSLTSIEIPEGVTSIGDWAFAHCSSLTSIKIPNSVTSIGSSAFYHCTSLMSIEIPDSVTSIGDYAFQGCTSLTSIIIPEGVTSIGGEAFWNCTSLMSIEIPDSVTSIGDYAFYNCTSLYLVESKSTHLNLTLGGTDHGRLAYYAQKLIQPSGTTYKSEASGFAYIDTPDGFRFVKENGKYQLIAYLGTEEAVTLPLTVEGQPYEIYRMRGVKNVIIPEGVTSIGAYAFYNCTNLASITIGDGVTSIGSYAFRGCTSLTSITIPDSVTSIDYYAFSNCTRLTSITIPDSVTSIGSSAFEYCTSLTSITFGENSELKSIGSSAFEYCTSLTSITFGENSELKRIGSSAFSRCTSLTSIEIPEGVTSIGALAFSSCSGLTSITIPDSVTSIDYYAFSNCTRLTSITIPDSVTSIGSYAFRGCTSLTSITIPDSVTSIGESAFANCPANVTVAEGNAYFVEIDGVLYNKGVTQIVHVTESVTEIVIPAMVTTFSFEGNTHIKKVSFAEGSKITSIGDYAFRGCTSLTSIIIPEGVTSIGGGAFSGCTSLVSIEIPDSVTSIEYSAFRDCTSLTSIEIPEGVTSIGSSTFSGCTSLTSITIPDSVTSIGGWAFEGCTNLTSITIPDGVTNIGSSAFSGCTSLPSITIPDSVTSIGDNAFSSCSSLTSISFGENSKLTSIESSVFAGCTNLTSITIPEGVTSIGGGAFRECSSLTSITIPEGVTSIGGGAFQECSSLTSITFGENSQLTSIGSEAFRDCTSLTSIEIPEGVTSIGGSAFSGCTSLTSITIPDSVTSIGGSAFSGCTSLTSIEIPDGVTSIGGGAFYQCTSLTSITIPDSVTSIGSNAFSWCTSLTSITIPDSVTSIDNSAFSVCTSLYLVESKSPHLNLTLGGTDNGYLAYYAKKLIQPSGTTYKDEESNFTYIDTSDGFRFVKENGKYQLIAYLGTEETVTLPLTVEGNSYELYQVRGVKNVIIPEGVTSIGDDAFQGCTSLTSITIPEGVTSIGYEAFYHCTSLTSITFGENSQLTSIGSSAFYYCTSLTSIEIPDSVTSIGSSAFWDCTSLTSITIPDSVTSIGSEAFRNCTSLTSITIPDSVTSIGVGAFDNTAYYNDSANWEDGALYIGKHLIRVVPDTVRFVVKEDVGAIVDGAFEDCYSLKYLTIGGNHEHILSSLTNLETLVLNELPTTHNVCGYFGYNSSSLPITLKQIVLKSGVQMRSYMFNGITGVTVYVEDEERDLRWDENYGNWHNRNRVVYGDKWITAAFYDADNKLLSEQILGVSQILRLPYVTVANNAQYSCYYVGWDFNGDGKADAIPATSSTNVQATLVLDRVVNKYTCTFFDEDGTTVLGTATVDYGTVITAPANPTKPANQQYTYTFAGFEGFTEGMTVTGNVSFKAEYNAKLNKYTYTFYDEDGTTVLKTATVDYGTAIVAPADPTKAATAQYTYIFAGFDGFTDGMTVTGNVSFKAEYNAKLNKYTYTFYGENGTTVLKQATVDYGTAIVAPAAPTKAATAQYTYIFAGFEGFTDGMTVTGNVSFKAEYNAKLNKYTYTFYDENGTTVLKQATVDYGTAIVAPADPTKAATAQYTYTFAGFDAFTDGMVVTGNVSFTATYVATLKGVLSLVNTNFTTAWGLEFVTSIEGTQTSGTGGVFTIVLDPMTATLVSYEAAEGVTVAQNGYTLTVAVMRAVEENEALLTLTMKTSEFLSVGEHAFLSTAEDAEATFAPIVIYEMGDVNTDGKVNSRDVVMIKQHIVKMITLTDVQLAYANVYVDESLNSRDAVLIQQSIVKMPVELGDRKDVTFVTETEEKSYTVRKGCDFTAVPEAPEGYVWSANETAYVAPKFTAITADVKFYLVKRTGTFS